MTLLAVLFVKHTFRLLQKMDPRRLTTPTPSPYHVKCLQKRWRLLECWNLRQTPRMMRSHFSQLFSINDILLDLTVAFGTLFNPCPNSSNFVLPTKVYVDVGGDDYEEQKTRIKVGYCICHFVVSRTFNGLYCLKSLTFDSLKS